MNSKKQIAISPDGVFYLRDGGGRRVPRPYSLRWLLPRLLKDQPRRWVGATLLSLALMPVAGAFYFAEVTDHWLWAVAILMALPIFRIGFYLPVLIDMPAYLLALTSAALAVNGHMVAAVLVSFVAGACRESSPVFAALWSWSPWPLLGVLACGWWRRSLDPDDESVAPFMRPVLKHPLQAAFARRLEIMLAPSIYVLPWGGAFAGFAFGGWQLWTTAAVAYGQMLTATDSVRLYQWAAPVVVAAACNVVPEGWLPVLLLLTVFHMLGEDSL